MARSQYQPGPATDHYHDTLGVDETPADEVGGDLSLYQAKSEKDQASGYAGLDGSGKLLAAQLPGAAATDVETAAAVAALSAVYQPLDSDLTAIAALTTTSFGRSLLALADQTALQSAVGAQPLDSDLTAVAALSPANDDVIQRKSGAWTNRTIAQLLTDLGIAAAYQPLDSDLTSIAALTTTTFGRSLLAMADAAAVVSALGITAGAAAHALPVVDVALRADINGGAVTALPSLYTAAGAAEPGDARNVVNGEETTWAAVTGGSTDRGFRIDLGSRKLVTSWRVINGNRAAKLQYSRDDSSWNDVTGGTVPANATTSGTITAPVVARYWRLIGTAAGGDWVVTTINIYGYMPAEVGQDGTATSESAYVNPATNINDGDDSTWTAWQGGNTGKWVKIDLGAAKRIRMVRTVIGERCLLQCSTDDTNWFTTDAGLLAAGTSIAFLDATARYWRIRASWRFNSDILLYTFQLFAPPIA